uniref:Uncharacterized protein n=1 Tax=Knipowitschia caucasica TaxID=637954 RepID=A0AAV2M182_KNICA
MLLTFFMSTMVMARFTCCVCVCVLLLAAGGAQALRCDWLDHYSDRTAVCLQELSRMRMAAGDLSTDLPFPNGLYNRSSRKHVGSQLLFVQHSLQHLLWLFRNLSHVGRDTNLSHVGRDAGLSRVGRDAGLSRVGRDTERFLSALHSQISRMQPCVSTNHNQSFVEQVLSAQLSRYYGQLLNSTLNTPNESSSSRQSLKELTRLHLHRLDMQVESIRKQRHGPRGDTGPEETQTPRRHRPRGDRRRRRISSPEGATDTISCPSHRF